MRLDASSIPGAPAISWAAMPPVASANAPATSQRTPSDGRIQGRYSPGNLSEAIDTLHLLSAATRLWAKPGFVPRQSLPEAGSYVVSRIVPQQAPRLADIGLRMPDVPGPERLVSRRRDGVLGMPLADQATQRLEQRVERHAPAHRDVVDLPQHLRIVARRRQQIG